MCTFNWALKLFAAFNFDNMKKIKNIFGQNGFFSANY